MTTFYSQEEDTPSEDNQEENQENSTPEEEVDKESE